MQSMCKCYAYWTYCCIKRKCRIDIKTKDVVKIPVYLYVDLIIFLVVKIL